MCARTDAFRVRVETEFSADIVLQMKYKPKKIRLRHHGIDRRGKKSEPEIVEQDPAYQATFVLPPMVKEDISDEELDAVAGGCGIDFGACGAQACGAKAGASLK